jgi:hypothetical protein
MATDPLDLFRRDMPEAVAAYEADRLMERSTPEARLREELPTVASVEALRGMSPDAVFAAWLDGRSLRRQIEAGTRSGRGGGGGRVAIRRMRPVWST